ncbi:MAG: VCBS repeat-containing protein [Planctomycetota bacterium]
MKCKARASWTSLAVLLGMAPFAVAQERATLDRFELPVRLSADDNIIDTGAAWGHSSPCVEDLDGDGLEDLIIGDFGGKFRWYRKSVDNGNVSYQAEDFIQAGDEAAAVRIYCCIGSQARFGDLNGDGIRDMIANSYDPGHCYIFWGLPENRFAAREELLDKAGVPIRSAPIQKQDYQSFGSFFELVDWDDDGDLDMMIGCFDGTLKMRMNVGTKTNAEFATKNIDVEIDGEPLKVKAHLCPKVADWDGDGLWDIVAGSDDGSVTFFRNIGTEKAPNFAEGERLVDPHNGVGYNRIIWEESEIVPGIRSQVEVTDYNADGKLDLLLGDFYTAYNFKSDLSDENKQEIKDLIAKSETLGEAYRKKMDALRADFAVRYPGDEVFSDEADKAWQTEYLALRESPEAKEMEKNESEFVKSLRPFLAKTRGSGDRSFDLAESHGHVWLYLRK